MDGRMRKQTWVKPDRIVGIFYDIAVDEFVLLRADGTESREPHSPSLDRLADEYRGWFQAANDFPGPYVETYAAVVTRFTSSRAA